MKDKQTVLKLQELSRTASGAIGEIAKLVHEEWLSGRNVCEDVSPGEPFFELAMRFKKLEALWGEEE